MNKYASANSSLWPRQARPQGAMPKAIVTGLCVGIIVGISTNAVLSELQPSIPEQVIVHVREAAEKPVLAAAPAARQETVAASPALPRLAVEIPNISAARTAVSVEPEAPAASTDGRGGEPAADRGASIALTTPTAPPVDSLPVTSPAASTPTESVSPANAPPAATPWVETAESAKPAAEPTVQPRRVVQKKRKQPTSYSSRNQNPFFPFFGGGNPFFGHRG